MVAHSTVSIMIILAALVFYFIPQIPIYVTTLLGCVAMALTGVISPARALSGFSNPAALMIIGMMVMGKACFTTGLAKDAGRVVRRFAKSEKQCVLAIMVIGILLGTFLNANLVAPLLLAIVNVVVSHSEGRITRKATYMPASFGALFGNNLTTISSSSAITAMAIIGAAGYGDMGIFSFTAITLPATLACLVFYYVCGYRLSMKVWRFEERVPPEEMGAEGEEGAHPRWKKGVTLATLALAIAAMVNGFDFGIIALLGACVLILTNCIDAQTAIQSVSWPTYLVAAAALGMSAGLTESGGGEVVANVMFRVAGPLAQSPIGVCIIVAVIATLLSNLMADTATVAIMVPIGLAMARTMGVNAVPMAIAAAVGSKVAVATPVSGTSNTLAASVGYRFTDYLVIGGLLNVIQLVVTAVMLQLVYF